MELAEGSVLKELRPTVKALKKKLGSLESLMESTAKLHSQLLEPLDEVRDAYKTRYLQAYDEVVGLQDAHGQRIKDIGSR